MYIHLYAYIYIYIYIHTYIHTYIDTYIDTYIHTHKRPAKSGWISRVPPPGLRPSRLGYYNRSHML